MRLFDDYGAETLKRVWQSLSKRKIRVCATWGATILRWSTTGLTKAQKGEICANT